MGDGYLRLLADHRRELAWYHSIKAYRSSAGLRWIFGRLQDWKENDE